MKNILGLILLFSLNLSFAQKTIVKTQNGSIEGETNASKNICIFKGIPFAQPPVGELRWKAPQAVKNWKGVLNCTSFSASPMQAEPKPFMCWSEEFIAQPEPLSEDCLYLNVWTKAKTKTEKLPVFVWIYGGGLSSGSANCAIYDGEEIAKKGVVFVSINYRVGVFGFMAHPELSKESGHNSSGNYGFLDQMEALRWVQKNIAAFGGDPKNVTIAGQSAGSFSVNALVASPLAKGLFHKAIAQSGGLLSNRMSNTLIEAEKAGATFMQKAKVNTISELRSKSTTDIQALSTGNRFGTTLDNYVLPVNLLAHFTNTKHNDVPLLTGWVTGDGALMGNAPVTVEKFKNDAKTNFGAKSEEFLSVFSVNSDDEAKQAQAKLALFQFAALPSHLWAGSNAKNKSYLYQFSHVSPDKPDFPNYGAFHTSEVPYALHSLNKWKRNWQQTDLDLENTMSSYWVNFAKTGNPNGKDLPVWEAYNKESGIILELGDKVILQKALFKKELDFLEKASKK
jgi:para-nitrobenzyl esterase